MSVMFPLSTSRLTLRLFEFADGDWMFALNRQPEVARYLLGEPWVESQVEEEMAKRVQRTGLDGPAGALALAVEWDRRPIGSLSVWLTDRERGLAEIGWVFDPAYGGQGFAREAAASTLALAFADYGVHRVAAQMDARNTASARLAEAIGMRREAHLRQDWWCKGEWTDTMIYGALSTDRAWGQAAV